MYGERPYVSRKKRFVWTAELDAYFVHVVGKLGGPIAATPRAMLDLMIAEAPDLTKCIVNNRLYNYRMQVFKEVDSSSKIKKKETSRLG